MTDYYVWSGATGGATGADWANAYIKLSTAMAGKVAGDVFYVADDHSETQAAALAIASVGTEAAPCRVYCVLRVGGTVPPIPSDLRTTALIATTVASTITLSGMVSECYGIIFQAGSAASAASITVGATLLTWRLVNCLLKLNGTATTSRINLGISGGYCILENTTVQFGNVSQGVVPIGRVSIRNNGSAFIVGATIPTNLFIATSVGHLFMEGADLSNVAAGKNLYLGTGTVTHYAVFKDCKLGAGGIVNGTIPNTGALELVLIRCDSGDVNYRSEKYARGGRQKISNSTLRTDGASDGTTPISILIEAITASCIFEALPISIWNETVGSAIVVSVHISASVAVNNKEIWMDVEYLGTDGVPLGSRVTTGVASQLDAAASYSAGSGWTGGNEYVMSATITPQEKGPITIYLFVKHASASINVDPKPLLS